MEAVEEPPGQDNAAVGAKENIASSEASAVSEIVVQTDMCEKSNGVVDTNDSQQVQALIVDTEIQDQSELSTSTITVDNEKIESTVDSEEILKDELEVQLTEAAENTIATSEEIVNNSKSDEPETKDEVLKNELVDENNQEVEVMEAGDVEVDGIVETSTENVLFETEILIENNVDDQPTKYKIIYDPAEPDASNNILSELGQNIELSDVLRSSDITENVENNNSEVRQEVFNKEELLDILEGNDVEESRKILSKTYQRDSKKLETQLALQQLTRLKQTKRTRKKLDRSLTRKSDSPKDDNLKKNSSKQKDSPDVNIEIEPKPQSIVNALVKDWEDDDPGDGDHANKNIAEGVETSIEAETLEDLQNSVNETKVSTCEDQTANKTKSSEQQPQRRLSRVIKKKVIFDPDNPDTFTKTKVTIKKENQSEKDIPTPKKVKVSTETATLRSNSKSPILTKSQWKKPQPKNSKKNNRLTEIDKLLMDEGAVNMICQLTPEAPKGYKNMKSKAEFIKKIQSSTPDSKEMKFRERKKELKTEEGEPKKIGKERLSVKSGNQNSFNEEFVAHSADDSIIYRRHSSSSYSSSCMSPMRVSDLESANQSVVSTTTAETTQTVVDCSTNSTDVFMAETDDTPKPGIINKKDIMSIKEKLNSKLSLALNKRKRESSKVEKPSKIKRASRSSEKTIEVVENDKYLRLTNHESFAEICILNHGICYNIEMMKELKLMLENVDANKEIAVTLLTSESGTLCSGFMLKPLLIQEVAASYAEELAEAARSLLLTVESHSKLLCTAVGAKCQGLGLSLAALSDVTVASDTATFQLSHHKHGPLLPGCAALVAAGFSQYFVNELLVFERSVSAAQAQREGLVSRTLWPHDYLDQARAIAADIANQPKQNVLLKKQLLRLKRGSFGTLSADLEAERDLFVKYWTSADLKELVSACSDEPNFTN